jgi:hypothetical protein
VTGSAQRNRRLIIGARYRKKMPIPTLALLINDSAGDTARAMLLRSCKTARPFTVTMPDLEVKDVTDAVLATNLSWKRQSKLLKLSR